MVKALMNTKSIVAISSEKTLPTEVNYVQYPPLATQTPETIRRKRQFFSPWGQCVCECGQP